MCHGGHDGCEPGVSPAPRREVTKEAAKMNLGDAGALFNLVVTG